MLTVLDIETTVSGEDRSPSPYLPDNYIVSVGWQQWGEDKPVEEYHCVKHNTQPSSKLFRDYLDEVLSWTSLLIGHNIKFDLSWLQECGFTYNGKIYDTMIYEYVKAGSRKERRLDLSSCCKRYGITGKIDEASALFHKGVGYEDMPWNVVEEYGRNDVDITRQLYEAQNA